MTHRARRSRARAGHQTATGPVTPTRPRDRWGRAETERTALGEALVMRRRTRVRFPPPPHTPTPGCWLKPATLVGEEAGDCRGQRRSPALVVPGRPLGEAGAPRGGAP